MTAEALIGLIMLVVLLGAIFIGVPISFTLLFLAFAFGYVGLGGIVFDLAYFQTIGMMKEELLAAVPLFIFMGFITEQAGLMERLFLAFRMLFAPVRGALFLVVILTSTVFAMATGIVGAAVTVLGIMASPIMVKAGYDARLSAGAITAGGTLGILIPPSVMLVVMGPVLGVSVADLYAAAFGPGFLLAGMYIAYLMTRAFLNPKLGPPVPVEERIHSTGKVMYEVIVGTVPLIGLITATLGSIIGGLATPTEAAGIGSVGALVLAIAYRRLTLKGLKSAMISTMATSSMVLLLAVTSNIFGAVFARLGSANWITETMLSLPLPPSVMLIMVLALIFLLGWPFEWPAIILVFPADLLSDREGPEHRHDLVRRAGCGGAADGVPVATGRHVGVLPQTGGEGLEPQHDLRRHVPVHDPAGDLRRADARFPRHLDLVSGAAAGSLPQSGDPGRTQEDHGAAEEGPVAGRRRLDDTEEEVSGGLSKRQLQDGTQVGTRVNVGRWRGVGLVPIANRGSPRSL